VHNLKTNQLDNIAIKKESLAKVIEKHKINIGRK
jgi:hypothetical protein